MESGIREHALTLSTLAELGKNASREAVDILEDDIASIIYTSGTTGTPKGAILSHGNILSEVRAIQVHFKLASHEVMLSFLPLAHVLARAVQFFQLAQGCQAAYAESFDSLSRDFREVKPHMTVVVPRVIEKIYEKINSEILQAVPFKRAMFKWGKTVGEEYAKAIRRNDGIPLKLKLKHFIARLLVFKKLHKALGGRIKFIISGGAPLQTELAKFFHAVGFIVLEGYGLTETMAAVTVNRLDDYHLGTVGKPLTGVEIKISDDGEILLKGGMIFKGYFKGPQDTTL